jgi:hypothetical protein
LVRIGAEVDLLCVVVWVRIGMIHAFRFVCLSAVSGLGLSSGLSLAWSSSASLVSSSSSSVSSVVRFPCRGVSCRGSLFRFEQGVSCVVHVVMGFLVVLLSLFRLGLAFVLGIVLLDRVVWRCPDVPCVKVVWYLLLSNRWSRFGLLWMAAS